MSFFKGSILRTEGEKKFHKFLGEFPVLSLFSLVSYSETVDTAKSMPKLMKSMKLPRILSVFANSSPTGQ